MDGRRDEAENCLSNLIVDVPLIDEHVRLIGDDLRVPGTHTHAPVPSLSRSRMRVGGIPRRN